MFEDCLLSACMLRNSHVHELHLQITYSLASQAIFHGRKWAGRGYSTYTLRRPSFYLIIMASPPSSAEEFDFVEEPSRDFFCPVTLDLLREPHQTLCCGNHISPEAITTLQESGKPCPLCKKAGLKTLPDQFFKRQVNALKVCCLHKSAGCPWVGELGGLERHLSAGSAEGECKFEEIACEFSHAGCSAKLARARLAGHKRQHVGEHLSMVVRKQAKVIATLQQQVKQLAAHLKPESLAESPTVSFIPPPAIIMTDFSQHKSAGDSWQSPPFYSHIGGYKMCLEVDAKGYGDETQVSVFVYLMRGEYDDDLLWPFRGDITLQLCNRREDAGHIKHTVVFDDDDDATERVTEGEQAGYGLGDDIIPHTALCYDASKNTEFLVNDSLKFRVTAIKLKNSEV